jgi:hypothetical protein
VIESRGIVLKTFFTSQCKIALLDSTYGKIVAVPTTEQICNGALVRYMLDRRINTYHARSIEQHALPLTFDHANLFFYHHVLELCYYFIPLDSGPSNLFDVVQQLCYLDTEYISYRYKILFLVRLFLIFGMHTEIPHGQWPLLKKVFATDIDSIILETIDLSTIDEMRQWLQGCLAHHPLLKKFKTLQFLNKIEMESR